MTPMSNYLQTSLIPFLTHRGVSDTFIKYTVQVIEAQGVSLLRNWDDIKFRKTVLLLGSEEGLFYEPAGRADIKCFVVVTIRNSPLETLQSKNYREAGLAASFSNSDVKALTSHAIRYFNPLDFSKLCQEAKACGQPDLYRDISAKYPAAWAALKTLGTTSAKVVDYPAVPIVSPYQFPQSLLPVANLNIDSTSGRIEVSYYDGYTPTVDEVLLKQIQTIANASRGTLLVDSFKVASRNFEKLLQIIEFMLTRNKAFSTANYFLENGHIERRMHPLRAAHTVDEMRQHFSQTSGLGKKHVDALKALSQAKS